ncbi:MAG: DEAD/DEAH box helicase [Candidatus Hodarchaeota archaeon]
MPLTEYKGFKLDDFQQKAIQHIENFQSVLVSAPTGSGKTLIAEYAIEKVLRSREKRKIFYTSPLKALSNQKYLDFSKNFGAENVGLLTGDITVNREAKIVIMTTEILRNMLYQNPAELLDVVYVVFDEIHYINDPFRGTVWEESLILLLPDVKLILLSATIANFYELADWLTTLRQEPIHAISHFERSVPLRQFVLRNGLLTEINGKNKRFNLFKKKRSRGPLQALIRFPTHFFPVLVFVFSRRRCEESAIALCQYGTSFLDAEEKERILYYSNLYLDNLTPKDRNLRSVKSLLWFVKHGVAIHHAGLLPSLKEFVEKLFTLNLIKLIFATETFAMGVNFPAKTTFFPAPQKWDGIQFRFITPNEYIQMSGRAGRRGIDLEGFATIDASQLSNDYVQALVEAQPAPLQSQFRVGYNLVASLRLDPSITPTEFLDQSFYYYQIQKARNSHNQVILDEIDLLDSKLAQIDLTCEKAGGQKINELEKYNKSIKDIRFYQRKQETLANKEFPLLIKFIKNELCVPGRLVHIRKLGWCVCTKAERRQKSYYIKLFSPKKAHKLHERKINKIRFSDVILDDPNDRENKKRLVTLVEELKTNPPSLTSYSELISKKREELVLQDQKYQFYQQQIEQAKERQENLLCHDCPHLSRHIKALQFQNQSENRKKKLKRKIWPSGNELFEKFAAFEEILTEMGYLDEEKNLTRKGLILSQISNEHDLLLTEWLFSEEDFHKVSIAEIIGLLSSFVVDDRSFEKQRLPKPIRGLFLRIWNKRKSIIAQEKMKGIECESLLEFNIDMYKEIHQWCQGRSLDEILTFSSFSEGQILSALRRLINLLLQLKQLPEEYLIPLDLDMAFKLLRRGEALVLAPKDIFEEEDIDLA